MQITLSVRAVPGLSKDARADIKYYERFIQCEFSHLISMLNKDYIYSPWNYLGYEQGTANICSLAQFVVIDVDSTSISITDRLAQLADEQLNCIVATTQSADNPYKYRILLPIDQPIGPYEYRLLVRGLHVNGLITDMDPVSSRPAQKFYSYADSTVLFNFDGHLLPVNDFIADPQQPEHRALEPTADVSDILHEFDSYQTATKGNRTKCLLHAAYRCLDYGLTDSQLEAVITYVNSRFLIPKDTYSVQRRVLQFIKSQRKSNDI